MFQHDWRLKGGGGQNRHCPPPPPLKEICHSLGLNKYNEKVEYLIHSTIFLKVSCESVFSPPPRRCNTHNKTTRLSFAQYHRGICKKYVALHGQGCQLASWDAKSEKTSIIENLKAPSILTLDAEHIEHPGAKKQEKWALSAWGYWTLWNLQKIQKLVCGSSGVMVDSSSTVETLAVLLFFLSRLIYL